MGKAKDIEIKLISRSDSDAIVKRIHYSGTVTQNSQIHLGVFMNGKCHGAMQFGPPLDRSKVLPIVRGATWESVIELNRMAFGEALPRNSESRALAVAFRMFRQRAPQVKWVLSFADACQCGDGAIYRASGFVLTGVKRNQQIIERPDGARATAKSLSQVGYSARNEWTEHLGLKPWSSTSITPLLNAGCKPITGYQFRYVRFIDESWRSRLAVPVIPFDRIPQDARMYRGSRLPVGDTGVHPAEGGAGPTQTLHECEVPDGN